MLDLFSATIEKLYAAAADASLWEEALRGVEDYTGSTGAVLNLVPKQATARPIALAGSFSRDDCTEYATNYMWRCPRIAFAAAHPEVPIHFDRMIMAESEMDRDPTYEWYGSHGLRYYVAGWIGETASHRAYMSLQRSRRQGHIEPAHVEQFTLVLRHMAQALALAAKLGTLDRQCHLSLALLSGLKEAVFVLDADGKLLMTNERADAMLAAGDGLASFNGRLQCRVGSQQGRFEQIVRRALAPDSGPLSGGWLRLQRASGGRPYVAVISPLVQSDLPFSTFEPKVVLIVGDPGEAAVPDRQALHELFALTDAEARLASALSGGHSLESAAATMGMQPGTARSHLKHIFRKLGVNRQQDLVRLLTSLSNVTPLV